MRVCDTCGSTDVVRVDKETGDTMCQDCLDIRERYPAIWKHIGNIEEWAFMRGRRAGRDS